jgi:hypothetical protein
MRLESHAEIRASPQSVWELTQDIENWPVVTPTITTVERLDTGPLRLGSTARIKQPGQRPAVWTVTAIDPPRRFAWAAKVFTITMTGTHQIETTPDGSRNNLSIDLTGFASKLVGQLLRRRLQKAIDTENEGFKRAAEASVASATSTE